MRAERLGERFTMKLMLSVRQCASGIALGLLVGLAVTADAQLGGASGSGGSGNTGQSGASTGGNIQAVQQVQQQLAKPGPSVTPAVGAQDPSYKGSIVRDKATDGVLDLTLDSAIQRGIRNNLGLVLQSSNEKSASGQKLQELQALLPTVTGAASITVQQINLAAYGLKFPGLNPIIGPFQVIDFRAYLTQNLVNLQALENYLSSKHNFEAAKLSAQDARDLVVLTVGNAYLLCIADAARIDSVKATMDTSKVSLDQANSNHEAGTAPRLDVLRAQVDYQNEQQQLIAATNQFEKDKIALARTIGLPLDQKFTLTDTAPYAALDTPDPKAAFEQALKQRKGPGCGGRDAEGSERREEGGLRRAASGGELYGRLWRPGHDAGHSHSTYTATGQVSAPILQLAKTHGDEEVAAAQYDQSAAKLSDAIQQVNQDIRAAILDIQTAAKLVDATKSNVDLAREALDEAQQRYKAGVADSLPVSQALAADEQANDQYISALYQHNVAKLALARALGVAGDEFERLSRR